MDVLNGYGPFAVIAFAIVPALDAAICALTRDRAFAIWKKQVEQDDPGYADVYGAAFRSSLRQHILRRSIQATVLVALGAIWIIGTRH